MVVVAAHTAEGINCGQVQANFAPCVKFLQSGGPVPVGCCSGVRNTLHNARSTFDRRFICNCLKVVAGAVHGLNPTNAQALPGKCGVNIPYKISTSTNCNRYISLLM